MKIQFLTTAFLCLRGVEAFLAFHPPLPQTQQPGQDDRRFSALEGQKSDWIGPVAVTAALGWILASQAALATVPLPLSSSLVLSVEKLDFSLPSYEGIGSNTGGFGAGSEARLTGSDSMTDPGANEKAKQEEATKKAEEARLARKAAEKQAKLQRNEDIIRQAEEKKKRDAQRLAEFFSGQ